MAKPMQPVLQVGELGEVLPYWLDVVAFDEISLTPPTRAFECALDRKVEEDRRVLCGGCALNATSIYHVKSTLTGPIFR
jgi:hypothetical protein